MALYNDPYGVNRYKARKMFENQKSLKLEQITEQIAMELKNISKKLQELKARV